MIGALTVATTLAFAATAHATFPGTNGRIVFAEKPPGTTGPQIASVDPGGTNRIQLTTAVNRPPTPTNRGFSVAYQFDPSWSPDGGSIAFGRSAVVGLEVGGGVDVAQYPDIAAMSADGTATRRVVFGPFSDPVFNPNGTIVAYECAGVPSDSDVDLCAAPASGPGPSSPPQSQKLVSSPANDTDPTYAADGRLFWVHDGNIWVRLADGAQLPLNPPTGGASPSVSPDNRSLAFAGLDGDIYIAEFATVTELVKAKRKAGRKHGHKPRRKQKAKRVTSVSPYLVGSVRNLTSTPGLVETSPSFSPDGTKIAYIVGGTIYVAPVSGGPDQSLSLPYPVQSLDWGPATPGALQAPAPTPKQECSKKKSRASAAAKCKKRGKGSR